MKFISLAVVLLALAACNATTGSINADRAEAPIRKFCPAFLTGAFALDATRSYGNETLTTFKNESRFNCRCVVKSAEQAPSCQQVRRFVLGNIEY